MPQKVITRRQRKPERRQKRLLWLFSFVGGVAACTLPLPTVQAQNFRFSLRAEPDVIPANGISTTSILVQVQNTGSAIAAVPMVRFITTQGTIERQARLTNGVARVLLRSTTTPGTAIVTAIIGNAREQIPIEFTSDNLGVARYLEVSGSYVAYGSTGGTITASGACTLDLGETHIESDVRLDVDLMSEQVWAEGGAGRVVIRHGKGGRAHELRGDRLYYDLRRRRGVMRRSDTSAGSPRQEFMDSDFKPIPASSVLEKKRPGSKDKNNTQAKEAARDNKDGDRDSAVKTPGNGEIVAPVNPPEPEPEVTTQAAARLAPAITPAYAASSVLTLSPANVYLAGQAPGAPNLLDAPNLPDAPAVDDGEQTTTTQAIAPVNATAITLATRLAAASTGSTPTSPSLLPREDNAANADAMRAAGPRLALVPPERGGTVDPNGSLPPAGAEAEKPPLESGVIASDSKSLTNPGGVVEMPLPEVPNYQPLPSDAPPADVPANLVPAPVNLAEPMPPTYNNQTGYWVVSRKLRVFPHDKVQFDHATIFFNGNKLFSMPRYVVSLNGTFNPATDMVSFNTQGGLTLNVPYYYQASPRGTGTVYFQHAPSGGFVAEKPGFALALDHQYWLSDRSQGRFIVDQIGRGGWNLNWEHKLQLSPTMSAAMYLDMPRHRDAYMRTELVKEFRSMQVGFEGLYSRQDTGNNAQGQFFARLRPKQLGNSGWTYTLAANAIAVKRYSYLELDPGTGGGGDPGNDPDTPGGGTGGVGLPGGTRGLQALARVKQQARLAMQSSVVTVNGRNYIERFRPLIGQTVNLSLQAPSRRLWKGAALQTTLLGTAFNYSDGRRGLSPGLLIGLQQNIGRNTTLQIDYNYDRSAVGIYGDSYSHFISGSIVSSFGNRIFGSTYFTKSLTDGGIYGSASVDYYLTRKTRFGLFSDYSQFGDFDSFFDYGLSLGQMIGQREVSLNWSKTRGRFYVELGNLPVLETLLLPI